MNYETIVCHPNLKKRKFIFTIDKHSYVEFTLPSKNILTLTCCQGIGIKLYSHDKIYQLNKAKAPFDDIREELETVIRVCKKALQKELTMEETTAAELGKLYTHATFFFLMPEKAKALGALYDESGDRIANQHLLWFKQVALFMYNTPDGTIKLLVTPPYFSRYFYDPEDPENQDTFIHYHEYLKNYHIITDLTLSKKNAEQWIEQATWLLHIVEQNITRLCAERKC